MENEGQKSVCLAEQENGHRDMYLVWVHQGDGLDYAKCSMCGWIKPDSVKSRAREQREGAVQSSDPCDYCTEKRCPEDISHCLNNSYHEFLGRKLYASPPAQPEQARAVGSDINAICALGSEHKCISNVNNGYCAQGTGSCMFKVLEPQSRPSQEQAQRGA